MNKYGQEDVKKNHFICEDCDEEYPIKQVKEVIHGSNIIPVCKECFEEGERENLKYFDYSDVDYSYMEHSDADMGL